MNLTALVARSRDERANLAPPEDGRILVHVVVNVEHWPIDRAMPRALLSSPHGVPSLPDVPNYSWYEYGMREGMPRFLELIGDLDIPASASLNSAVIDQYPRVAAALRDIGWEVVGHGVQQESLHAAEDEPAVIARALDDIERYFGDRPIGWLGPGLAETDRTLWHLSDAGVRYVLDWVMTELPLWFNVPPRPVLSIPYNLELNDSVLHAVGSYPSDEMYSRMSDTLRLYEREVRREPRLMTVPLHPHLMGVPHRFVHLERALRELADRDNIVFTTGSWILDWFSAQIPAPTPDTAG